MTDFDGNFMWLPPSSPSPRTMLNQTDNGLNPMNEIFPQANLSKDHNHQSEQRPGLGEILASSTENVSPFSAFFRNQTVPSPVDLISPRFNPSALLQSPMSSNSSHIIPPELEVGESSDEGNAATLIFNNNLHHQPLNFDLPQEEIYENPTESHVEPFGAPLVASAESDTIDEANNDLSLQDDIYNIPSPTASFELLFGHVAASFESQAIDEVNNDLTHQSMKVDPPLQKESDAVDEVNIISMEEERKSKDEGKNDEEKVEDHVVIVVDELNDGASSSKKRKFEETNMIGATRKTNAQRIILQMESEEDNPDDGFEWIKYGVKVVKGNTNPRSYYKCKANGSGCEAKKRIQRGAQDDKLVITTYEGFHDHLPPTVRRKRKVSHTMNRSDSSMPPLSLLTAPDMRAPSSSLSPQTDMTNLFLTGLSKLPSLQVNHQNE